MAFPLLRSFPAVSQSLLSAQVSHLLHHFQEGRWQQVLDVPSPWLMPILRTEPTPMESSLLSGEKKSPPRFSSMGFLEPPQSFPVAEGPIEGLRLAAEPSTSWDGAFPKHNLILLGDALNAGCPPNIGLADMRAGTCRGAEWITGTPVLCYPVINVLDLPRMHQQMFAS